MSRFDSLDDDGGIPMGLWEQMVSNAITGKRGQAALAELELALEALPSKRLIYGSLAKEGTVCAVGAYVASKRAERLKISFREAVEMLNLETQCACGHAYAAHDDGSCTAERYVFGAPLDQQLVPCSCEEFRPEEQYITETVEEGTGVGLTYTIAWHLAYLNDEQFEEMSPEERYEATLGWVRRAQGKETGASAL